MPTQASTPLKFRPTLTGSGVQGTGVFETPGVQGSGLTNNRLKTARFSFVHQTDWASARAGTIFAAPEDAGVWASKTQIRKVAPKDQQWQLRGLAGNADEGVGALSPADVKAINSSKNLYDIIREKAINPNATYGKNGKLYRWNGKTLQQIPLPSQGGMGSWFSKLFKPVAQAVTKVIPINDPLKLIQGIIGGPIAPQPTAQLAPPQPTPPPPQPQPAKSETPAWLLPAGIGLALVLALRK